MHNDPLIQKDLEEVQGCAHNQPLRMKKRSEIAQEEQRSFFGRSNTCHPSSATSDVSREDQYALIPRLFPWPQKNESPSSVCYRPKWALLSSLVSITFPHSLGVEEDIAQLMSLSKVCNPGEFLHFYRKPNRFLQSKFLAKRLRFPQIHNALKTKEFFNFCLSGRRKRPREDAYLFNGCLFLCATGQRAGLPLQGSTPSKPRPVGEVRDKFSDFFAKNLWIPTMQSCNTDHFFLDIEKGRMYKFLERRC